MKKLREWYKKLADAIARLTEKILLAAIIITVNGVILFIVLKIIKEIWNHL